jgi:putative salt-induced outer membrane protein YdiY
MNRIVQRRALGGARTLSLVLISCLCLLWPAAASAQDSEPTPPPPLPPPPGWTGSFGAGLALTQGNRDTSTVNAAYEVKRDYDSPLLFKSSGLFLRGKTEGELTARRLVVEGRVDWSIAERTTAFGQVQFLADEFKEIDYLISPTFGIAQTVVKNSRTELILDGGVGTVSEKNQGVDVVATGGVIASETFKLKLTETAEISQKVSALWKMNDFSDALYIFGLGIAANITSRTQLKTELLDTYKYRPPSEEVQKNDVAVLLSFVYKF